MNKKNSIIRTHDRLYLKENRYDKPKEMFKFIEKIAFKNNKNNELVCDIGCAAGEFLYFLKRKHPNSILTGADIRTDLLLKAKRKLPKIKFLKGSVTKKNLFKENSFNKIFLIGVHPIFDNFEPCFANVIKWTKKKGNIFICDLMNPFPVDVLIKYKLTKNYKSSKFESGWNIFSRESISLFLKKNKKVKSFKFYNFEMPFDLKKQKDPIRSWTFKTNRNQRLMFNGLCVVQNQTLLSIKLK